MTDRTQQHRANDRRAWVIGIALAWLTVAALAASSRDIGYVRDEGVYFEASRHYGAWVARLFEDPGRALRPKVRDRYFRINHEHPVLMKLAAGVSARLLARPPIPGSADTRRDVESSHGGVAPLLREGSAMRLPGQLVAGVGVLLLFLAGHRQSRMLSGGVLAAGWFILLPHVAFHASLHAFDVPIAVAGLAVVLAYRRALVSPAWGIALGPVLGIAMSIKHNALFFGALLVGHYYACLGWAWLRGRRPTLAQVFPLPLLSMVVLAPWVAIALWPWMWHETAARVGEYFAFHGQHSYYNMEFLGVNYNRPPLPLAYPFVMTLATVPITLLALAALGATVAIRADLRRRPDAEAVPSWSCPLPTREPGGDAALLSLFALFPLLLIALPSVPIFGGTKHWLTAYPFMALLAAHAWSWLWRRSGALDSPRWRRAPIVALLLVLGPAAWATIDGHPYNLSQYAPLAGGARGAASAGLNRGFWGHAVVSLLDRELPSPVYLHDIHGLAVRQYEREGRWPAWEGGAISRARSGLVFHELHTIADEVRLWNAVGTTAPTQVIQLDDVPLTTVYSQ